MPNNLVFNNVAEQLKTQLYASNGTTVEAMKIDANGNLLVAGTVSVGNTVAVTGTVNVGTVTVTGTVSVGTVTVTGTVDVGNTVTVTGTVSVGTVTVTGTVSSITSGVVFTATSTTITTGTGTAAVLQEDTSQQQMYSYYIKNNDPTNAVTVALQVSPTSTPAYFIDDGTGKVTISANSSKILTLQYYLNYTRLYYDTGTNTANIEAWYNSRL